MSLSRPVHDLNPFHPHNRSSPSLSSLSSSRLLPLTPAFQRHSSNPMAVSPLQQSFPAYSTTLSAPGSPPFQSTPTREPRSTEQKTRARGESRSSSAPVAMDVPRSRPSASSPKPSHDSFQNQKRRSVKHLTCYYWKAKGACRHSEEDCLYAHHDTGMPTDPPRQLAPGEPAKAGRSLERAMKSKGMTPHKSSSSLSTLASRPVTPLLEHSATAASYPSPNSIEQIINQLQTENTFLRGLVDRSGREKETLMNSVDSLNAEKKTLQSSLEDFQAKNQHLRCSLENLQTENQHVRQERDLLRSLLNQAQAQLQQATTDPFVGRIDSKHFGKSSTMRPASPRAMVLPSRSSHGENASDEIMSADARFGSDQDGRGDGLKSIFRGLGPSF